MGGGGEGGEGEREREGCTRREGSAGEAQEERPCNKARNNAIGRQRTLNAIEQHKDMQGSGKWESRRPWRTVEEDARQAEARERIEQREDAGMIGPSLAWQAHSHRKADDTPPPPPPRRVVEEG